MPLVWTDPFPVRLLLDQCFCDDQRPPCDHGVYVVTAKEWTGQPTKESRPLYVGGNTGRGDRFRTRIGDLIADMFGFSTTTTGHSCGGKKLYDWCRNNHVNPSKLFIGWADRNPWCPRCAEIEAIRCFIGDWSQLNQTELLNERRPPRCTDHEIGL